MNCKLYQREIEHIGSKAMSGDALRHVENCAACRGFKQEHESLQMLLGNLERVAAPANFDTKLRARLAVSKTHKQSVFASWLTFSLLRPAVGVSLALALLVGGFVFVRPLLMNEVQPFSTAAKALEIKQIDDIYVAPVVPKPYENTVAVGNGTNLQPKRISTTNASEAKRINANDMSVGTATNDRVPPPSSANETISIAIRPESRSPYLMLKDKKVPLRSVSFGSPTFVNGSTSRTSSSSDSEGIW